MWRRKRKNELEEVNLLDVAPVRVAKWQERGERVVVERPQPTSAGLARAIDSLLHMLSARRIRLDTVGSYVWLKLDGVRTVSEVADMLRGEFGDAVEPAEERLGHLVRVFRREGLVAYPGWDDEAPCDTESSGTQA